MPRFARRVVDALFLCLMIMTTTSYSGDTPPEGADQRELMMQYLQLAQPGPEHERLAVYAGSWDVEMTLWLQPGAEPMVIQGTATTRMVVGGRFLMHETRSEDGTMESMGILGFDRRSGQYQVMGMDNSGTYFVTAAGPWDEETGTAVLSGEDVDPIMQFTQRYDFVYHFVSADEYRIEVIFKDEMHTRGGEPFKMVEVTYRRAEP